MKYGKKILLCAGMLLWVLVWSAQSGHVFASDSRPEAEVVWAQSDGLRLELFRSRLQGGTWNQPQQITNDNADNVHPSVDTGPDGITWLAWTAIEQGKYEIRYTHTDKDGNWLEPASFPSPLPSNIAPSLVVDGGGVIWMVWSGNDGVHNDEIYYSRFQDGKWQQPALVNQPNNVPDILPELNRDADGSRHVRWQGYRQNRYIELESSWSHQGWTQERIVEKMSKQAARAGMDIAQEKKRVQKKIELPSFVPDDRQACLRIFTK